MITVPYPYCFTDEAAKDRVFKFIILPNKGVGIQISNSIDALLYKQQLRLMLNSNSFNRWPTLQALSLSVREYQRRHPHDRLDEYIADIIGDGE